MVKVVTTCCCEIWSGFFGIDADGNQPDCNEEIMLDVEEDSLMETDEGLALAFTIQCPKCKNQLESGWQFFERIEP